ncbi:transporter, major facilitator family protein [Necator americanus]|uniref:Transporter, major facilitator family protein n=1 Tax=Necator americanus TaxID=51031 RepID=W2TBJ5_NECAM|nr:transporter, major facilitator family protein [Necator americanus]ETN78367.1 transporter, major facilitator family protein [Necator americanus]
MKGNIFYNYTPRRDCADANVNLTKHQCDLSTEQQCELLKTCSNITIEDPPFHSMVEEFDLYCDKAYYATLVSTIQFLGVLFGAITYGHLGDYFGRRPVSFCGIFVGIVAGISSGFSPSWQVFAALRFVCGTSIACILVVFYTYIVELIRPEQRVFMRSFFNWGYARAVFTVVCMLCDHWRSAAIATSLLASPTLLAIAFLLPETPKWYLSKGRLADAKNSRARIKYLSGKEDDSRAVETYTPSSQKIYTMKDLMKNRTMATKTFILCSLWFATSLSAFGSDLNSGNLLGDFYVNQIASAAVTAFAKIILVIACYSTIMCLQIFVPDTSCDGKSARDWAIIIINIIGVSFIELTWDACYLIAVESFPTYIRTIGMGTCSLAARIGALVAPQMAYLSTFYQPAPYMVVVAIGIIAFVISLAFLPNTKGVDLGTIGEENRDENQEKMQL